MEKNINQKIAGVSLVEIMITMFLIALLLLAMVAVFPRMTKYSKQIHEGDVAKLIAAQVLDELQALPTNCVGTGPTADLWNVAGGGTANATFLATVQRAIPIGGVTYKTELIPGIDLDLDCSSDLKTATVTVKWTKDGKPHNVKVTGIIK
jgi:type II secretory pathway pseudopilin PulG